MSTTMNHVGATNRCDNFYTDNRVADATAGPPFRGAPARQWHSMGAQRYFSLYAKNLILMLFLTLPSLARLRALDRSSSRANTRPTLSPRPRTRKRPRRSWGSRAWEPWGTSAPRQLLAHHLSRRYVSSPDSLSWRMARVRFLTSKEPGEEVVW